MPDVDRSFGNEGRREREESFSLPLSLSAFLTGAEYNRKRKSLDSRRSRIKGVEERRDEGKEECIEEGGGPREGEEENRDER